MADRVAVMNAGEIVQIGRPEEVYNQPATRFVADFLGEANFLDGHITSSGHPARVNTGSGEVVAIDTRERPIQSPVKCCVRPEHIRIRREKEGPAPDADNALPATIVSHVYLGDVRQYVCRCDAQTDTQWRVAELADGTVDLEPGDRVVLTFASRHVALLDN